jgi:hypothetical protein
MPSIIEDYDSIAERLKELQTKGKKQAAPEEVTGHLMASDMTDEELDDCIYSYCG